MFRAVLLGVQVTVLGIAIFVRFTPICLIGAPIVSALIAVRAGSSKRVATVFFVPLVILLGALYGLVPLAFSKEANSGRLQTLVWHRVFVSLGVNPEWPFPGVREEYRCPQTPGALRQQSDSNGACVWFAAPMNQSRPAAEVWADLYGPDYERVLRQAFFHVAVEYPGKTLATFLYYKPQMMIAETITALKPWKAIPASVCALVVLQFVLVTGFLATEPVAGRGVGIGAGITIALALVLFALIPHFIAWTTPPTGQELAAGAVSGAIIALWLGCRAILRPIVRRTNASAVLGDREAES